MIVQLINCFKDFVFISGMEKIEKKMEKLWTIQKQKKKRKNRKIEEKIKEPQLGTCIRPTYLNCLLALPFAKVPARPSNIRHKICLTGEVHSPLLL